MQLGDAWADYERPVAAADSVDGVGDGGWGTLRGNFNRLVKLKKQYPCIHTFIEGNFVDTATYNVTVPGLFDGIDIDWEYPGACGKTCAYSPEDTQNFTLLLEEFRRELEAETAKTQKHYALSIAAPASKAEYC